MRVVVEGPAGQSTDRTAGKDILPLSRLRLPSSLVDMSTSVPPFRLRTVLRYFMTEAFFSSRLLAGGDCDCDELIMLVEKK